MEEPVQGKQSRFRFTAEEKEFLWKLVLNYPILNSSGSDQITAQKKNHAWRLVQHIFNSVPTHTPRSIKQLKKRWDNHKTRFNAKSRSEEDAQYDSDAISENGHFYGESIADCAVKSEMDLVQVPEVIIEVPGEFGMEDMKPSIQGSSNVMLNQTPWLPRRKYRRKNCSELNKQPTEKDILDTRYRRLKKHVASDDVKHKLLKKELELRVEIAALEKKRAETDLKLQEIEQDLHKRQTEADLKFKEKESELKIKMLESELKFKEEEQVHKRKVWEIEKELLSKKLNA